MTNKPQKPNRDTWHDRLVDRALQETVGGQTPPDLTERIITAADASRATVETNLETDAKPVPPSVSGDLTMATPNRSKSFGLRGWILAASVIVNVGLAAILLQQGDRPTVASNESTTYATQHEEFRRQSQQKGLKEAEKSVGGKQLPRPPADKNRIVSPSQEETVIGTENSSGLAAFPKFTGDLAIPYRKNSFDLAKEASAGAPASIAPRVVFKDEGNEGGDSLPTLKRKNSKELYLILEAGTGKSASVKSKGRWGFQNGRGRQWPSDQAGGQWHGSDDGRGIGPGAGGDQYARIYENAFIAAVGGEAISTFSIDVDTASYANTRQFLLNAGQLPPADAVRLEELVNYFRYHYEGPSPESDAPFAAHVETTGCPWAPKHRLVRIGIKGREVTAEKRPLSNLVFLIDVSGSMQDPSKLPLVKQGMKRLAEQLGENDRVAIVVYASQEGLVLPSTPGTEQEAIIGSLDNLAAGGSTAGGAGIALAYQIAEENFIKGGTNRVILCSDGDFNVGTTSTAELERLVEKKAKETGVFLSVIGFGRGNLNDAMMEKITGIGNGNYYYVDGEREAERVFVKGMTGMLVTIAKDVKIQVEFNPAKVAGYRLLGYENRMLKTQDFNDDKKDAGEIGAGHTVTCLYEIIPAGEPVEVAKSDELKYQRPASLTDASKGDELLTLKMRYKQPDADISTKIEWPATDTGNEFGQASEDLQFAAAVASFGMLLRDSEYQGDANFNAVLEIAAAAVGDDPEGERAEFLELVQAAKRLTGESE